MNYRRIYPNKGRVVLDGGLNSKYPVSEIPNNESPDCANVVFTNGAVETRQGIAKATTSGIASAAIDGLYTRDTNTGGQTMIAFCNGSAWQYTGTTFTTIGSAQSVFTAGVRVAATNYENHLFVGNGNVIPYKYNGTDWTRHGVYPPTTTATVASNGAGVLGASGGYRYRITYVNTALAEGDLGPATTTFVVTSSSGQLRLTSIPVAPQSWGVASRKIYRTVASGTVYKLVTTLADNTTTTYDDNTADASLGATAPSDNGVPPLYGVIAYHQNRLFVNDPSTPNYLWYSNYGEPYTFASTNFIPIGDASGDYIRSIGVYQNSIIVGCSNSTWLIYMASTTTTDWTPVRLDIPYGTLSPFCQLDYNNKFLFPAVQNGKFVGFSAISGKTVDSDITLLTVNDAGSDRKSDKFQPDMDLVQESYLGNISGIVFKNKIWVALTYDTGNTRNNRVYVGDFSIGDASRKQELAWVPFTGWMPSQFSIYNGDIYFGTSALTGFVYKAEAGVYNDDNAAIDSYIYTKEFSGFDDEVNFQKDFRYANILVEKLGAYYMDLTYRTDSDTGVGETVQINLDPGGSQWGSMIWGTDEWGGGVSQEDKRVYLGTTRGKRIQFKFSNQNVANQRFKVHGLNLIYNRKGYR